jgi:Holliday junction resolvase YEN1
MLSPRKRRSLESTIKAISPKLPPISQIRAQPSTPERVNRKIDFQASISRASPSPTAFPSLQDLFSTLAPSEPAPLKDASTIELPSRSRHLIEHEGNVPHRRRETEITTITSSPPNPPSLVPISPLHTWPATDENKKPQRRNVVRGGKKYLMLRDSLPGAWKEVDESMVGTARSRAWRQSEVEILDMTAD